jgi:hypothetical protein
MKELFFVLLLKVQFYKIIYSFAKCCGGPLYGLEVYSRILQIRKLVLHREFRPKLTSQILIWHTFSWDYPFKKIFQLLAQKHHLKEINMMQEHICKLVTEIKKGVEILLEYPFKIVHAGNIC